MKYGIDCVYPPNRQQAQSMINYGWSWIGVYIGGPRAASDNSWQEDEGSDKFPVRRLADVFDGFLPIYVGRNQPWDDQRVFTRQQGISDGDQANILMGACGFNESQPCCLDVEYGTYQAHPADTKEYILGWVQRLNEAGHPAGLYSDMETLNNLEEGLEVDFKWGAAWVRGSFGLYAPTGRFDPQQPPPWDVWQFASGGAIGGVNVDLNSMTDDFVLANYG
jgi:hypothetical protein